MSSTRHTILFDGTPYEFYGFVKGLEIETYLGLGNEKITLSCFTIASKDHEENISSIPIPQIPYRIGNIFGVKPDQARKQTVARPTEVTPDSTSSIVYLKFFSNLPDSKVGWITAQIVPGKRSKLILNFDYEHPVFKNFWDILLNKLNSEGWISKGDEKQHKENVQELPIKPKEGSTVKRWLDYYHEMKAVGLKYTLTDLAADSRYSLSHLKKENPKYKRERGI